MRKSRDRGRGAEKEREKFENIIVTGIVFRLTGSH